MAEKQTITIGAMTNKQLEELFERIRPEMKNPLWSVLTITIIDPFLVMLAATVLAPRFGVEPLSYLEAVAVTFGYRAISNPNYAEYPHWPKKKAKERRR